MKLFFCFLVFSVIVVVVVVVAFLCYGDNNKGMVFFFFFWEERETLEMELREKERESVCGRKRKEEKGETAVESVEETRAPL